MLRQLQLQLIRRQESHPTMHRRHTRPCHPTTTDHCHQATAETAAPVNRTDLLRMATRSSISASCSSLTRAAQTRGRSTTFRSNSLMVLSTRLSLIQCHISESHHPSTWSVE